MRVPFRLENSLDLSHPSLSVKGGIPLPRGQARGSDAFRVLDSAGQEVPAQVNVTGYWPDGSVKWVLVILTAPVEPRQRREYQLLVGEGAPSVGPARIVARETEEGIEVNTGTVSFSVSKHAANLFSAKWLREADMFVEVLRAGEVIRFEASRDAARFSAVLEEAGTERAVIRLQGVHVAASGEEFGNYTVRIYSHAGSSLLHLVHSFIYTGDPQRDFIKSIGLRFRSGFEEVVSHALSAERGGGIATVHNVEENYPIWRRAVLSQDTCLHYSLRKWTDPDRNRAVTIQEGGRAQGWGRLSSAEGGLTVGLRNFWQECPRAIEINPGDGEIIAYLYSPYAEPMDFRRYSDWVYGRLYESPSSPQVLPFDQKMGAQYIGKTSELFLDLTPGDDPAHSARQSLFFQERPILTPGGEWIAKTRVFGDFATVADAAICPTADQRIQELSQFLLDEVEYRKWYGFADYGDIMHSYDPDRDLWWFDRGGYAWLNNEFMMCEAMWHAYLYTGDHARYRFAEAMTRHTGDVDMYHLGRLAGHGIRHNVNHWGCLDKERRMTVPLNKRLYYFLTGDEHTRDLVRLIYDTLCEEPLRKEAMDVGVGGYAALFLWETTGDAKYGEILKNATETFCAGRVNARAFPDLVDLDFRTGLGAAVPDSAAHAGFFLLMFGPMHILVDSVDLTESEAVRAALLEWAELLHLPQEELHARQPYVRAGKVGGTSNMRALAYAYQQTKDPRYLDYLRHGLGTWIGRLATVGGTLPLDVPEHRVFTDHAVPVNLRHCEYMNPSISHLPFGLAVLREAEAESR